MHATGHATAHKISFRACPCMPISCCRLLASQLPSYDPFHPSQKVTTSAAFLVARGALCSQPLGQSRSSTGARFPASGYSSGSSSTRSIAGGLGSSCWVGGAGVIEGGSSSNSGWSAEAAVCAVGSSWPCWEGSSWDVTMADCILPLWSPASGKCELGVRGGGPPGGGGLWGLLGPLLV